MPSKTQLFVVSSNTVPGPHLEVESDSTVRVFCVGNDLLSPIEDIVLSNVPSITTAPPTTAKITKTPTTSKIFFLFPVFDFSLVVSVVVS